MKRRRYIATWGAVASLTLAGCGGDGTAGQGTRGRTETIGRATADSKVSLIDHRLVREGDITSIVSVKGSVKNTADDMLAHVEAQVRFLDDSGNRVLSRKDNTTRLPAGQTWSFVIQPSGTDDVDISTYELTVEASF